MQEKNIINPDYLSRCTHQIAIGFSETEAIFSTASSFLYSFENRMFLITNWHNVTGKNPFTGEPLSSHGGIPDTLLSLIRILNGSGKCEAITINLYEDKEMTIPRWLVHPKHKENVDVIALEIVKSKKYIYSAVNEANFEDIKPEVGDDCFVIGYPFEDFRYLGLPIWKNQVLQLSLL